jgi:hypothetical protein
MSEVLASVGRLAKAIMDALRYRDELKAKGVSPEDLAAGLERSVRDAWPKPVNRTQPWRYECDLCEDTGLRLFVCRPVARCDGISTRTDGPRDKPGKYLRLCAKAPESSYEHSYGVACLCARGGRFVPTSPSGEDFTTATKSKPMTRWGR